MALLQLRKPKLLLAVCLSLALGVFGYRAIAQGGGGASVEFPGDIAQSRDPSADERELILEILRDHPTSASLLETQGAQLGRVLLLAYPSGRKSASLQLDLPADSESSGPWTVLMCTGTVPYTTTVRWDNLKSVQVEVDLNTHDVLQIAPGVVDPQLKDDGTRPTLEESVGVPDAGMLAAAERGRPGCPRGLGDED